MLTYRIMINPCDQEKGPSAWPYHVALRLFKHFNNMTNSTKCSNQSIKKIVSDNSRVAKLRDNLV